MYSEVWIKIKESLPVALCSSKFSVRSQERYEIQITIWYAEKTLSALCMKTERDCHYSSIMRVLAQYCTSSSRGTKPIKFQEMPHNRKNIKCYTCPESKKEWSLQLWLCQTGLSYGLQQERMKAQRYRENVIKCNLGLTKTDCARLTWFRLLRR